jgi:hypothetical protein
MNEPLNGAIRISNENSDLFEFGESRDGLKVRVKERMRQSSYVCCPLVVRASGANSITLFLFGKFSF